MYFRGKQIDPLRLWANYCEIKDDSGPFLPLTFCPNPNHLNSNSPAFQINIAKPTVHCFAYCGISGSYEHAICVIEGIYDKYEVTEDDLAVARTKPYVGEPASRRASRGRVYKARKEAKRNIFRQAISTGFTTTKANFSRASAKRNQKPDNSNIQPELTEEKVASYSYLPTEALAYLKSRGIGSSSISKWQLGFNEETERITIPVRDSRDRLKFVIERGIRKNQRPAYLYPDNSCKSALLYGACALDRRVVSSQGLIVVEGTLDCIMLHQHGYKNTVAILGNALSKQQLREIVRLNPKRVYLMLDKDEAGVRGMERAASMLDKKYQVKVPLYPKGRNLDPAQLSPSQLENAIRKAVPVFRIKQRLKQVRREAVVRS